MLREGLARGITPPQITLRDVPEQIRNTIPTDIDKSPLLTSFSGFPDSIDQAEQEKNNRPVPGKLSSRKFTPLLKAFFIFLKMTTSRIPMRQLLLLTCQMEQPGIVIEQKPLPPPI